LRKLVHRILNLNEQVLGGKMDKEILKQVVSLIKSGDKIKAEKLLIEQVTNGTATEETYYLLAICAKSYDEKIERLEKSLQINPDYSKSIDLLQNTKAQHKQQKFTEIVNKSDIPSGYTIKKAEEFVVGQRSPVDQSSKIIDKKITEPPSVDEIVKSEKEVRRSPMIENKFQAKDIKPRTHWLVIVSLIILAIGTIWQIVRIKQLEDIIDDQAYAIVSLEAENNKIDSNIKKLAAGLDYVTPLAENADRYAHTHNNFYSDIRLKENIELIENTIEKLLQIQGVYFNWNTMDYPGMGFSNEKQIGVIAQDVEDSFPELVSEDANGYKQIDYQKFTVILIEALKEQQKEIDEIRYELNQMDVDR